MSDYYDNYGYDPTTQETINAINDASATAANIGATWADYSGKKADREQRYKMWREQLEWNSPKAQLQRLREAGLTPFGAPISNGNMDSLPELGDNPMQAVASGLYRSAEAAIRRISSYTAVQEAKNRAIQVRNDYERLQLQKDLAPIQRQYISNQVRNLNLVSEFLSSSMSDRLQDVYESWKAKHYDNMRSSVQTQWMNEDSNGWDYYEQLYESLKQNNSYKKWLIEHGNALFDYQKERDDIRDLQWNISNNPFGFDIGTGSLNTILNFFYQALNLFLKSR